MDTIGNVANQALLRKYFELEIWAAEAEQLFSCLPLCFRGGKVQTRAEAKGNRRAAGICHKEGAGYLLLVGVC